jgi:mono/diheme cytochrome c family protein
MRARLLLTAFAIAAAALLAAGCSGGSDPDTASPAAATGAATEVATGSPSPGSASVTTEATPATTEAPDFASFYAENCATCHGDNRDGIGRAPALTPESLTDEVSDYVERTDDRTHNSIWTRTELDEDGRTALLEYLASTAP